MSATRRLPWVDALKAIACQLIVLHHLAFYGPMADAAAGLAPALHRFLADPARMAVQVFLVVGGYLAARSLAPRGVLLGSRSWTSRLWDRYLRLTLPLAVMLLLAIAANAWADAWMDHPSLSAPPTAMQILLHLLLLQDVADVDALSAGVWYVAIDFQLFALLLGLLSLARTVVPSQPWAGVAAPGLVLAVVATSLLAVNRWPEWDVAAPYFFGAYGLGVLVAWIGDAIAARDAGVGSEPVATVSSRAAWALLGAAAGMVLLALAVDFRWRIAVAGLTAALLLVASVAASAAAASAQIAPGPAAGRVWFARLLDKVAPLRRAFEGLSDISYAVFLIHFPVCLVVNAAFHRFVPPEPLWQALGVALAWGCSLGAGWAFHRGVERPVLRWRSRRSAARHSARHAA